MPPRKRKTAAAPEPCPACEGTGETPQPTRRRGTVRGQMGVCLACLGTGTTDTAPAPTPVGQLHP